jgi:hypothetical protein
MVANTKPEVTKIVDEWVDAPEGMFPPRLHILFDKDTRDFADQYVSALHTSRNIPFNINSIPVTDRIALLVANVFRIQDGNEVIRKAVSYYEKWAYEAQKHGWILALLENNEFTNVPTPYEPQRVPRGITIIPDPVHDLNNQTEYRLKQIMDYLDSDPMLQQQVMSRINDAFAKLVSEVGDGDKDSRTGFPPESTGGDVHGKVIPLDDSDGDRPTKRKKGKIQSVDLTPVGEAVETTE